MILEQTHGISILVALNNVTLLSHSSMGQESRCTFSGQFWLRVSEATLWVLVGLQFSQAWREGEDLPSELPWLWAGFSPLQMLS